MSKNNILFGRPAFTLLYLILLY